MREKVKFPRADCCCCRNAVRRGQTSADGYRLEAFSQSDVPSTSLDIGRRFVLSVKITNHERCMSECWTRNAHFRSRRLRPNYRRCGSQYDLASIPCAFRAVDYCLLGMWA